MFSFYFDSCVQYVDVMHISQWTPEIGDEPMCGSKRSYRMDLLAAAAAVAAAGTSRVQSY